MTDHDSSYKLLFSHPKMVRDLLVGFVHEEWVARLDFSTLEKVSGTFVGDEFRDRADDVIRKVRDPSARISAIALKRKNRYPS